MPTLAKQVNNGPVVFPPLQVLHPQVGQLGPAQPTGQAERQDRSTPLAPDRRYVRGIEQGPGLLGGQPVPESDSQLPGSLDAPNAGRRLWAHQTGIGSFVSQSAYCSQSQIDGGRG